jgi:uncharacterized protein YciI
MLFVIHCEDGPQAAVRRQLHYAAHKAHLRSQDQGVRIVVAGPLSAGDPPEHVGSLLIVEAPSIERVRQFNRNDPFVARDVWSSVRISAFSMTTDIRQAGHLVPPRAANTSLVQLKGR